jgi:PAS domain S-box-containing protein
MGDNWRMERRAAVVLGVILACSPCALAWNPSLDINQYGHKAWTVREGFFKGAIYAIAQTPDGYLWIGTEFGLERFDGVRSVPWQPPKNEHLPRGRIRSLLAARDGRLWIGTDQGLASWKDGKLTHYSGLDGEYVLSLLQDHEGTMWAAATVGDTEGRLCAIRGGRAECYGRGGSLGRFLPSLYEDRSGNLWVGSNKGVWRWRPSPPKLFPAPHPVYGLAESDAGELLIATLGGIQRLVNGRPEPYPLRGINQKFFRLRSDREGALWVGSVDGGLLHVRQDRTDRFVHSDGLSGDAITAVFEDREASIWVGTSDGLDRFREFAIPTIRLQRESRKFREVIETIPAMAWVALPDGSNEFVNRRWAEYTGLSGGETAASGWTAVVHPDDRQPYSEKWRACVATGEPLETEGRFRCSATGEYRWFHARGVPLRDKHGRIRRWYGILTDIEDRKRAEEEREKLHQLEADLAHINRVSMMGELAASIAHEVNQPLTGIVSNGSACLRFLAPDGPDAAPDLEEAREAVRDIVRDGKRAGEVIARIRALTKRTAPPREKLDLNETIREVLALAGDEAKKNSVVIRMQFGDEVCAVLGDRVQLQQVLLNLIMNAIQAMSSVTERARQLVITTRNMDTDQW